MAWIKGHQPEVRSPDVLKDAFELQGDITDAEARIWLGKIFRYNLGFTWEFISRQRLFEFQELILNGWFKKDNSLFVAGRGVGKSYLLAIFCCLYCLFYPGTKIVIVANNFRRVKDIFGQIEKFIKAKDAIFLRQCFDTKLGKANDQYLLKCFNGSLVKGLPLGVGENLRGERANVLIIDEGLLISEHVQETILRPFLTAKTDIKEQLETQEEETLLIEAGLITEDERTVFPHNKLIITSSASYQFEYLYEGIYKPNINVITDELRKYGKDDPTYFVARMGFEALPANSIMDESVIKAAQEGKKENPVFLREYGARFIDASDSYFSIKKLHECTIPDGDVPTTQVRGSKQTQYILAIDPAYGDGRAGDFFAMGVYALVPEDKRIIQVHSYGRAGADLKEHFEYLTYLLTYFNIVYTVIDSSGTEFIDAYNESSMAIDKKIRLGYIDADFEKEGEEYVREIQSAKAQLNSGRFNFVYPQVHSNINNRRMNEYLQGGISAKKVWFASKISQNDHVYDSITKTFELPFNFRDVQGEPYSLVDFLSDQDDWIEQTKRQLALIEVKPTSSGNLTYDIPSHLKKSKNEKRARRDNYTCLLLAYYASKHYYDMMQTEDQVEPQGFPPIFF